MDLQQLMTAADAGDPAARNALFTAFYDDLRRIARRELQRGGSDEAVSATTVVHELYAVMAARDGLQFADRARFLGYASRAMRGLIIDSLRQRHALKRGGAFHITRLDTEAGERVADVDDLQRLSAALEELAQLEPRLAAVVDLKYFCGFSFEEIAAMKTLSERTVRRYWTKARAYLHAQLRRDDLPSE